MPKAFSNNLAWYNILQNLQKTMAEKSRETNIT